eukprot:6124325-Alexandrium_andersonii.AAC.1
MCIRDSLNALRVSPPSSGGSARAPPREFHWAPSSSARAQRVPRSGGPPRSRKGPTTPELPRSRPRA